MPSLATKTWPSTTREEVEALEAGDSRWSSGARRQGSGAAYRSAQLRLSDGPDPLHVLVAIEPVVLVAGFRPLNGLGSFPVHLGRFSTGISMHVVWSTI